MKARLKESRVKFGVKIPATIKEAKKLDEINGNRLWQEAIAAVVKMELAVVTQVQVLGSDWPPQQQRLLKRYTVQKDAKQLFSMFW